jgi:hypothetical protein
MVGTLLQWKAQGVPFPGSNPYSGHGDIGLSALAMMGARSDYLGFPELLAALCPDFATIDWAAVAKAERRVLVGAIEVLSGNFEIFDSDKTLEELGLLAQPTEVRSIRHHALAHAAGFLARRCGSVRDAARDPAGASHRQHDVPHLRTRTRS